MNLTEEQLSELENMAGLFFKIDDIRIALDIPYVSYELFSNYILYEESHPIYMAYHRGRLTAEIQLRNSIKNAALNGSNPAQSSLLDFLNNTKHDE